MAKIKEERLTQLGGKAEIPASPEDAKLESFENPNPGGRLEWPKTSTRI